jgi:hypothetical protein
VSPAGRLVAGVLGIWLLLGTTGGALAHPARVARADIAIGERALDVRLSANLAELDLLLSLDADLDGRVDGRDLDVRRHDLGAYLLRSVVVTALETPLPGRLVGAEVGSGADGKALLHATLRFDAGRALGHVAIRCRLLAELGPGHATVARIAAGGTVEEFVFDESTVYAGSRGTIATAIDFARLGVEHILVGYDHLAFLVGLLLTGGGLLRVLAIVTAFTLAHGVTLALAALDVVTLPGALVEAAIAASIVWVGVENLLGRQVVRRWLVGFAFGLVHGFGFAAVVRDLGLPAQGLVTSLLAFNAGVEAGQAAIVVAVVPALWLLQTTRVHALACRAASLAILSLGLYWLYERLA